jgi:hypothetical protein
MRKAQQMCSVRGFHEPAESAERISRKREAAEIGGRIRTLFDSYTRR